MFHHPRCLWPVAFVAWPPTDEQVVQERPIDIASSFLGGRKHETPRHRKHLKVQS